MQASMIGGALILTLALGCSRNDSTPPTEKETGSTEASRVSEAQAPKRLTDVPKNELRVAEASKALHRGDTEPFHPDVEKTALRYPIEPGDEAAFLRQTARLRERVRGTPTKLEKETSLPTVRFGFSDLTTSVGESPLQLLVNHVGEIVTQEMLAELKPQVSLRRWPSLERVAADVQLAPSDNESPNAYLRLVPKKALESTAWYALVVEKLPSGFRWPAFTPALVDADGRHIVRFVGGEQPVVSSLRVCDDKSVYVDFSERIVVADARQFQFSNGTGAADCKFEGEMGASTLTAKFTCSGSVRGLKAQADSNAGKSLKADLTIPTANLTAWGDGCRVYRPEVTP